MSTRMGVVMVAAVCLAALGAGEGRAADVAKAALVSVNDPGATTTAGRHPGHEGHEYLSRSITMDTGRTRYGIRYGACVDKAHGDKVVPYEGYIGMPLPTSCNWYHGGFLFIVINGADIGATRLKGMRVAEGGERGAVDMVWDADAALVKARFLTLANDDKLLVEISLRPKKEIKSLALRMRCYPSFFTSHHKRFGERAVTSAVTTRLQGPEAVTAEIAPEKEWWLFYADNVFDVARKEGEGPCAMLFLPEQCVRGSMHITNYPVETSLELKPSVRSIRLAFWDFKGRTNADALASLKAGAEQTQAALRSTDFLNRAIATWNLAKEKAEAEKLMGQLKDATKTRQKLSALFDRMVALQRELRSQAGSGGWVDDDKEAELVGLIPQYEQAKWDLKFEALLAD